VYYLKKKSYKIHDSGDCGEDEECKEVVKMNVNYKRCIVLLEECIYNKVVPEIYFVALLKLKAPVRTISV
jgi:hypothetical protein